MLFNRFRFRKLLKNSRKILWNAQKSSGDHGVRGLLLICWFQGRFEMNFEMPNDQIHVLADYYSLT